MVMDCYEKASVLIEALPYMRKFYGKTVVIKYGGNAMINEQLKAKVIQDIILMKYVGMQPVVVHGGGPEISAYMKRMGKQPEFIGGFRVTDQETMDIAEMVLVGKLNNEIVSLINLHGGQAVGMSGKDAMLIKAKKRLATVNIDGQETQVDIGFVGDVESIQSEILHTLMEKGYIPVISPIGGDDQGNSYNINADLVAGELAGALKADKLVLLTDVEGIFRDYHDKESLISTINSSEIENLIAQGIIDGGMLPKVEACLAALHKGANKTHIIDGRLSHSLLLEVFTDQGIGTEVIK